MLSDAISAFTLSMKKSEDVSASSKAEAYIVKCKVEQKRHMKEANERERKAFAGVFDKL